MAHADNLLSFAFHAMAHDEKDGMFPKDCDQTFQYNFNLTPGDLKEVCQEIRTKLFVPEIIREVTLEMEEINFVGLIINTQNYPSCVVVQYFHPVKGLLQKICDFYDSTVENIDSVLQKNKLLGKITGICEYYTGTFPIKINNVTQNVINYPCGEVALQNILEIGLNTLPFKIDTVIYEIKTYFQKVVENSSQISLIKKLLIDIDENIFCIDFIKVLVDNFADFEFLAKSDDFPVSLKNVIENKLEKLLLFLIDDFGDLLRKNKIRDINCTNSALLYTEKFLKLKQLSDICLETSFMSERTRKYATTNLLVSYIPAMDLFFTSVKESTEHYLSLFSELKPYLWVCLSRELNEDEIHVSYHKVHSNVLHCLDCGELYYEIEILKNYLKTVNTKSVPVDELWNMIFNYYCNREISLNRICSIVQYAFSFPGKYIQSTYAVIHSSRTKSNTWTESDCDTKDYLTVKCNFKGSCRDFSKWIAERHNATAILENVLTNYVYRKHRILVE